MDLDVYGDALFQFQGVGELIGSEDKIQCDYNIGQLRDGHVVLLCSVPGNAGYSYDFASVFEFIAVTESMSIHAQGLRETNYLPTVEGEGVWSAYHCSTVQIRFDTSTTGVATVRYGITNFIFTGNELTQRAEGLFRDTLKVVISSTPEPVTVQIQEVPDYRRRELLLKTFRGVDVTSELILREPIAKTFQDSDKLATHLTYILSLARGTKVQWIYRKAYSAEGELLEILCSERVTKAYHGSPLIDPRPTDGNATAAFVEQVYRQYTELVDPFMLERLTLDAYLDATGEHDYIEMRAGKLAIALEALKHVFIQASNFGEFIFPVEEYEHLTKLISENVTQTLISSGADKELTERVAQMDKIRGLNRKSFNQILRALFEHIGLRVTGVERSQFLASRNSLVHTGRFYVDTADAEARKRTRPLSSRQEEYLFMVNLLNRIFLKLLGYRGPFIDWSRPGDPRTVIMD